MQVTSYATSGSGITEVQVELSLISGLPGLKFVGLPDAALRESEHRIRSAIKAQGFQWPRAQQIVVNLEPSHLKKSSRGVELAVAALYLWSSGQLPLPLLPFDQLAVLGGLTLDGKVIATDEVECLSPQDSRELLTGPVGASLGWPHWEVTQLKDLAHPQLVNETYQFSQVYKPPQVPDEQVPATCARLMTIIATGEHHALLCGPAGSGKTTVANWLSSLLPPPDALEFKWAHYLHRRLGEHLTGRPMITPHHSLTRGGLLGGGTPPVPGEISRAHSGVLMLDEILEFRAELREALREPLSQGVVRIARHRHVQNYPARFLLLATSNLCPCGNWTPTSTYSCRFSLRKCQSYLERLTGPVVDRFEVMSFSHSWQGSPVRLTEVAAQIDKAYQFRMNRGQTVANSRLTLKDLEPQTCPVYLRDLLPTVAKTSLRRKLALLRVARTLADLEESTQIADRHLTQAADFTIRPFVELEQGHR